MDDSQIQVPDSFLALFRQGVSTRINEPRHHVLARYETCEDLAQGLAPQARALVADLGVTSLDVAEKVGAGLVHPSVGLSPEEAQWVVRRLQELLDHGL